MHDGWFRFCGIKELFISFHLGGFSTCASTIFSSTLNLFFVLEFSLSSRLSNSAFDLWIIWNDVEILRSVTLHRQKIL
jgi:hypothetical protein